MKYLRKIFESNRFEKFDIEEIKSYFHTLTDFGIVVNMYYGFASEDFSSIRPNSMEPVDGTTKKFPKIISSEKYCRTPIIFVIISLDSKWNEFDRISELYIGLAEMENRIKEKFRIKIRKNDTKSFEFTVMIMSPII